MSRLVDMTGFKKGKITVIQRDTSCASKHVRWLCKCECGNLVSFSLASLQKTSPENLACPACRNNDLSGTTFGKLHVLRRSAKPHLGGDVLYDCVCTKCGAQRTAYASYLRRGGELCRNCDLHNEFYITGTTAHCRLDTNNSSVEFLFDASDYAIVTAHHWFLGGASVSHQPHTIINGCHCSLPHLLLGLDTSKRVLFKNKNTLDCRRCNLELADYQKSSQYARLSKRNTSGCKGVCLHQATGKWRARITVNGVDYHLGLFDTIDDAIKARKEAEEKFGYYSFDEEAISE